MSGKPKKNKAPAAKEPVKDEFPVDDIEEQPFETADIDGAPKSTDREKAPADAKKKKKGRKFRLSSVDPIILASFSIFMVACLIVSGIAIYDAVEGKSSDKVAEYGDTIEVYYTGSYIACYDQDGAIIFDTNMEEVGSDNEKYKKSNDYTAKDSYSTQQITVGQGDWLDEFKNALIGQKPGYEARVTIVDGYGSLTKDVDYFTDHSTSGLTVSKTRTFTTDEYSNFFGKDAEIPSVGIISVKSPYGWNADVGINSNGTVTVTYMPVLNEAVTVCDGLKATATSDDGATITFNYTIEGDAFYYRDAVHGDSGKMLKAVVDDSIVYIIAYNGTDSFSYKTTAERVGTTMYFVIKFVGYTTSS